LDQEEVIMEYGNIIDEMSRRVRCNCRICGETIEAGEPFYTDAYTTVHLECFFEQQKEGI
jgi:hypothetical protein